MVFKRFEIQQAVHSLRMFEQKRKGQRSYWNPNIYTEERSKQIINAVSDRELQEAGVIDIKEIRRLAG